jgi:hypothetical protein
MNLTVSLVVVSTKYHEFSEDEARRIASNIAKLPDLLAAHLKH